MRWRVCAKRWRQERKLGSMDLRRALALYLDEGLLGRTLSENTLRAYSSDIAQFVAFAEEERVSQTVECDLELARSWVW